MAKAGEFDEGPPGGVDEMVLDEEAPDAIGTLVEVGHGEVGSDGVPIVRTAAPNGGVGKETLIDPGVTELQLFGGHVFGAKDGVSGVVEIPIAMQDAAGCFHLAEERSGRVGSEDVEGGALEAVFFDPLSGGGEDVFAVVVESKNERTIHLNAVVVQQANATGILGSLGSFLAGIGEILIGKGFETDEDTGAAGKGHGTDDGWVVGDIDADGGAPDFVDGLQGAAESAEVFGVGAEIVVDKNAVGLGVGEELVRDLLGIAHAIGHAQAVGGEIAKSAAIVTAARGDEAGGGEETFARDDGSARRRVEAIVAFVGGEIRGAQGARLDIGEDFGPEDHAVADGQGVRVGRAFFRTR